MVDQNTADSTKAVIFAKTVTSLSRLRSANEWASMGVKVQHDMGELPRAERETTIAFLEGEGKAEICTLIKSWQRRLESDGAKPEAIQTYEKSDCDHRWYIVPKSWVRRPQKGKGAKV